MLGHGDHVAVPLVRVMALAGLLVSYPYWWGQLAALDNQLTNVVLSLPPVVSGLHELMLYAVDGVALGGWQLIDLTLMAAIGFLLLELIFLKVLIVLFGALLYATGPLLLGLVPTDAGAAIARGWASAWALLVALPLCWAATFAVGALLIGDAGTAGPLIAGAGDVGSLLGGVLLAAAGLASLWVCLRLAREAGGLLRTQLGGLLALTRSGSRTTNSTVASGGGVVSASGAARSIRTFTQRVAGASGAAAGVAGEQSRLAAGVLAGGRAAGWVGRRGVIGSAAAGGLASGRLVAPGAARVVGRTRAGALAVQMARAGTASWHASADAGAKISARDVPPGTCSPPTKNCNRSALGACGRNSCLVQRILQAWSVRRRRRSMTRVARRVLSSSSS